MRESVQDILPYADMPRNFNFLHEQGVMWWGPVSFIRLYICDPPKSLNGTLAVDLPIQTLMVDFSLNLWTSSTTAQNTLLIEQIKDFLI